MLTWNMKVQTKKEKKIPYIWFSFVYLCPMFVYLWQELCLLGLDHKLPVVPDPFLSPGLAGVKAAVLLLSLYNNNLSYSDVSQTDTEVDERSNNEGKTPFFSLHVWHFFPRCRLQGIHIKLLRDPEQPLYQDRNQRCYWKGSRATANHTDWPQLHHRGLNPTPTC